MTPESGLDSRLRIREGAVLSRGDLTEAEWRVLKDLLPVEREPGREASPIQATYSNALFHPQTNNQFKAEAPENSAEHSDSKVNLPAASAPVPVGGKRDQPRYKPLHPK